MKNDSSNVTIQGEVKGRGLFYTVIAVATFIIMAVGATFAYFTATTRSTENGVMAGSTTLELEYISYEGAWNVGDMIPASPRVVEYSFEYQNDTTNTKPEIPNDNENGRYNTLCKDDYGNVVCTVYVFQVGNKAKSPQSVSLKVVTKEDKGEFLGNGFTNLYAMAYQISEPNEENNKNDYDDYFPQKGEGVVEGTFKNPLNGTGDPIFKQTAEDATEGSIAVVDGNGVFISPDNYTPVYVNRAGVQKQILGYYEDRNDKATYGPANERPIKSGAGTELDRTAEIAHDITIEGNSVATFALVLYIKNEERDQTDEDANKTFSGQVVVGSGDGSTGVSGSIELSESDEVILGSDKLEDSLQGNEG